MPATATLEYPKNGFFESGTQANPFIPRHAASVFDVPNAAITRAQSLQASVGKLSQLFALAETDLPLAIPAVDTSSVKWHFRNYFTHATASSAARPALISWLLDLKAWGDETEQLKASVTDLLNLQRGWDGEDADPIDPRSAEHACAFIDALGERSKDFEPFPDPNGLVGLEAHKEGKAAYLSFFHDGLMAYVFRVGNAVHRGNKANPDVVKRVLNAVF